jgi:hypothetical protein
MPAKENHRLRVGVLGCGPIAQAAHFEACAKARNADLDRYYMLAHGSDLVDTARYFAGEIKAVDAPAEPRGHPLLVCRCGICQWHPGPSRSDRRRADGLARRLPDLRRTRLDHGENL